MIDIAWKKSSYSEGGSNCVIARMPAVSEVQVGDSQNPDQAPLSIDRQAWTALLRVSGDL
ncbi:DUF397 domain-containing protein [Nocardiopsis composta]